MSIIPPFNAYANSKNLDFFPLNSISYKVLHINRAAYRSGFKNNEHSSVSQAAMIMAWTNSIFIDDSMSKIMRSSAKNLMPLGKTSMYNYLQNTTHNWNLLALNLAGNAIKYISSVREKSLPCLVVDDSVLQHSKATKMENCSWVFDHNESRSVRGYNCLQIGWTNGSEFVPLGAKLLKSDEENKKPACPDSKVKETDGRTHGGQIRDEAVAEKPQLVEDWIKQVKKHKIPSRYVLMDSWFNYKPLMLSIKKAGLDVIGMLKFDRRRYYQLDRRGGIVSYKTLGQIADCLQSRKRRKNLPKGVLGCLDLIACNQDDELEDGCPLRIVFIKGSSDNNKFFAIASTDLSLTPAKILQAYSYRWSIETGFYNQKQYFGLEKECRAIDFDAISACANLACIRATLVEMKRFIEDTPWTAGELFSQLKEEIREIPVADVINLLLDVLDNLPDDMLAQGIIDQETYFKIKRYIRDKITALFSSITIYARDFVNRYRKNIQIYTKKCKPRSGRKGR